jgi:hypothetical protein
VNNIKKIIQIIFHQIDEITQSEPLQAITTLKLLKAPEADTFEVCVVYKNILKIGKIPLGQVIGKKDIVVPIYKSDNKPKHSLTTIDWYRYYLVSSIYNKIIHYRLSSSVLDELHFPNLQQEGFQ